MNGGLTSNATIGVVFASLSALALVILAAALYIYKRRQRGLPCRPSCMRRDSDDDEPEIPDTNTQGQITEETFVARPPGYYEALGSQELPPAYDNIFKNISMTPEGTLQPELSSYASSATLNTSIAGVSIIGPPPDYSTDDPLGRYRDNRNQVHGLTLSSDQLTSLSLNDVTEDETTDSIRPRSISSPRIRQMQVTGCILTGHLLPQQTAPSSDNPNGVSTSARPINVSLVLDNQAPQIPVIERDENDTNSDSTKIKSLTSTGKLSLSSDVGIQNQAFIDSDESAHKTEDQDSPEPLDNPVPSEAVSERNTNDTEATSHASSTHAADNLTRENANEEGIENKAFVDSDDSHDTSKS